jgi:DNA polymerase-1
MVTNYLIGIKDQIKLDGRVHPAVLIHGSRTGRPSYRNPPLQTIPQPYSVGADLSRIKEIFVADSSEHVLLECDYKQIEVFLAAFLSQDPQMLTDLESGDFHSSTAADVVARMDRDAFLTELKGKDPLRVKQRFQAKKVTFGNFYRQGADSLARKRVADCTYSEAASMLIRWRARYRRYEEWADGVMREAMESGELVTVTGRKRRFRVVHGDDSAHILRQSVNYPIQASANDYILTSLIELYNGDLASFGARVLLSVHDSMLFSIPKSRLTDCVKYIKTVMEKPRFDRWPSIEIEMKVGNSWGQMEPYP